MKTKEFIDEVKSMLTENKPEFEVYYHTGISKFLYGFRSRHAGDYFNHQNKASIDRYRIWKMNRNEGLPEITMEMTDISTVVTRDVLLLIANVVINEVNDTLISRYGKDAILHEYLYDPRIMESKAL